MARKSKQTNGIDADTSRVMVGEIERLDAEIETIKAENRNKQKAIREKIKDVYAAAKADHGIPIKALKAEVKIRKLDRQRDRIIGDMDQDEQFAHEQIHEALGELAGTPLGDAAEDAAKTKRAGAKAKAADAVGEADATYAVE